MRHREIVRSETWQRKCKKLCSISPESGGRLTVPVSHLDAYVYGREGVVRFGGEKRKDRERDTK